MDLGFESLRDRQVIVMEINYRLFTKEDSEAVIDLWRRCDLIVPWNAPEKDILRKLSVNDDLFILAEEKGGIIASAMGGYDGHRGYIYYLAVLPEFQKKGVGSEILKKIETKLLNNGCPKINLFVRNTNLRVQAFYKKNKYKIQESQIYGKRLIDDN